MVMRRRPYLAPVFALVVASACVVGCKSKAAKQSELAAEDVKTLQGIVQQRRIDSLPRALPDAAKKLPPALDDAATKFPAMRDKTEDLRTAKRSFFGIVDADGVIAWIDESGWSVKGRVVGETFPAVKDCLGGKDFARSTGRFGGDPPDALFFMDASPIRDGDKVAGCLISAWEAIDAASDLQSQILTIRGAETASTAAHNKVKEQRKKAMEGPDIWVGLFRGDVVYLEEGAYQPLEEATKTLGLGQKTASGSFTGTFDVINNGWGVSATRIAALGDDVGIVVFRHQD